MAELVLPDGRVTLIDDDMYDHLSQWSWCASIYVYRYRAVLESKSFPKMIQMHRYIMGSPSGLDIDHRNENKLDNRRANLRVATRSQNKANVSLTERNTSGFKGVSRKRNKWRATIVLKGKQTFLGSFSTPEEAAAAYDIAAKQIYGDFAKTNAEIMNASV